MRFHLPIITGLIFSLLSCSAPKQNLWSGNNYESTFRSQLAHAPDNKTATSEALPEMTSEEHERLGDVNFRQNNLQAAFVHYEKSLELNPDNPRVHYKKGILFTVNRTNEDAIKEFQAVLKKDSKHALAHVGLGQASFQMRKYEDAVKYFQKAIELDPNLWKAHNLLGVIYDYKNRHKKAAQEYRTAIALKPDNGSSYNNLGISYSLQGDYKLAKEAFKEALKNTTASGKIYNNLGLVLGQQRRHYEALEAFRKGGDEAQAQNNLGCAYLQQGEREKAIRSFEKAIESRPTFYAKASDNLKKARWANLHASSFDSNMPTPSNAQAERPVANLEKKPEKQEKAGAKASKEHVLQAAVSSDQVVQEKKLDSLPAGRLSAGGQGGKPLNLAGLRRQLRALQSRYSDRHPDVIKVQTRITKLDSLPEGRSNIPTLYNAQAELPVANLEKKPEKQEKAGAKESKEHVLQASVSSDQVVQEKKLAGGTQESINEGGSKSASSTKVSVSQITYAQVENPRLEGLDEGEGFRLEFMLVNTSPDGPIAGTVAIIATLKPPHKPQFISFPSMEFDDNGLPVRLEKSLEFTSIRHFKHFSGEFDFPFSYAESFRILVYNPGDQLVYYYALLPEEVVSLYKLSR